MDPNIRTIPCGVQLLWLLSVCLLYQSAMSSSCEGLNPFTATFPAGVLLPQVKPSPPTARCRAAWQNGTCCHEPALAQLAWNRNKAVDRALLTYFQCLGCFDWKLSQFANQNNFNALVLKNSPFLHKLSSGYYKETFKNNGNICWNHMKDVRGAVLCNSCAADSSKFFTDNGKASLHLSTCREMISICSDFFRQILSLLTGFGELKVQLDSLELGSIPMSNKLKILKSELDIIAIETKNHPILSHFKALDKPDNNSSTEESQKSICNSLYVFNDLTFIEKIKPLMVNTCYRMDEIIKGIKEYQEMKIMQSRSLKLNQFQPESRSLFQIESENTTEVDPILPTSNNDNIFKSDDSDLQKVFSTDSSVQPSPSDKVAMNCTFSFP